MAETFREALALAARENPDKPWLHFEDQVYTFREMQSAVSRLANGLQRLGVAKGDKVCFYLPNCAEFILSMFAVTELGAVFVPANYMYKEDELRYVVDHSDARSLICHSNNVATVRNILADCPKVKDVVVVGDGATGHEIPFRSLLEGPATPGERPEITGDDVAAILYTSGTTGRPKGVMLHHAAYVRTGRDWARHFAWRSDSNILCFLPLFHINAQAYSTMGTLMCQGGLFLVEKFSASRFWEDIRRWQITDFVAMPTIPLVLWNLPPGPDDRNHKLRQVVSMVPVEIWEKWEERFGVPMVTGFTMTECMLALLGPTDRRYRKLGSCGRPVEGMEAKVVGPDGQEVPRGTVGELVLRGWSVMKGYYKQPDVTAETLRDGWLHTGAAFRMDEDGDLWFSDRIKDIVRRGGENISSAEVEQVITSMPGIADAAVVPVKDPIYEEEVKAYVILKEGYTQRDVPPEAIVAWCTERLAAFKVPRYIEYRTEFPRTPTLKIQKAVLRQEKPDPRVGSWDRVEKRWIE